MEKLRACGTYTIESHNLDTGATSVHVVKNRIVQGWFTSIHELMLGNSAEIEPTDFVLGTGQEPAQRSDTELENEFFTKPFTTRSASDFVFQLRLSIGAPEGNPPGGIITEIGVKAGSTLLSRAIINVPKNENVQLLITWTLTMEG